MISNELDRGVTEAIKTVKAEARARDSIAAALARAPLLPRGRRRWPEVLSLRSDYSFASTKRERAAKKGKDTGQKVRWLWLTGNEVSAPAKYSKRPKAQLDLLGAA